MFGWEHTSLMIDQGVIFRCQLKLRVGYAERETTWPRFQKKSMDLHLRARANHIASQCSVVSSLSLTATVDTSTTPIMSGHPPTISMYFHYASFDAAFPLDSLDDDPDYPCISTNQAPQSDDLCISSLDDASANEDVQSFGHQSRKACFDKGEQAWENRLNSVLTRTCGEMIQTMKQNENHQTTPLRRG